MRATRTSVVTPTPTSFLRSLAPVGILAGVILLALVMTYLLPSLERDARPLAASNSTPGGARAVVQVMRAHGVEVVEAASALEAVTKARQGATLVVAGAHRLNDEVADAVHELPSVLYLGTGAYFSDKETHIDSTSVYEHQSTRIDAACDVPAARAARAVAKADVGMVLDEAEGDFTGCFPIGTEDHPDQAYLYVEGTTKAGWRGFIAAPDVATNRSVDEEGHAALVINAAARTGTVVWYVPNWSDTLNDAPTPVPAHFVPVLVVLVGAGLVLGMARGRRLGRLVPEDLPSHVPAAETVIGRGRLLRHSKDHAHTARVLRRHTARALARRTGVSTRAPADELHAALVQRGVDPNVARDVLWGPTPTNERELMALSDRLTELEETVRHV
ncbi:DUF4350 domain-containing protein [Schaalia sp. 19OD2882]|uniref:DUF4350 domain-containing protein n=1 Tax=Schaalia sp. 19OD2882 TaxID=2794089 RepID=UPI001C1F0D19|nr:DUF4350 domain-containing protein [Schaalia sp. 19OD2882]QWW20303.1 DUF4350 domain-containing protein [Schaalia sp. 19OD2882]